MMFQKYNKRTGAYVKFETKPSGRTKILNVKEKNPKIPFKGVKIRK